MTLATDFEVLNRPLHQVSPKHINQFLAEWLAFKVSYIQVDSKCNHFIFTSSEQRSPDPLLEYRIRRCHGSGVSPQSTCQFNTPQTHHQDNSITIALPVRPKQSPDAHSRARA